MFPGIAAGHALILAQKVKVSFVCRSLPRKLAASFGGECTWHTGGGDGRSPIGYLCGGAGPLDWLDGRYHGMFLIDEAKFTSGDRVP